MRLHALLMAGKTACGVHGRQHKPGRRLLIVTAGDRVLRIAKMRRAVTCQRCLRAIGKRGEPLPWPITHTSSSVRYLQGHRSRAAQ